MVSSEEIFSLIIFCEKKHMYKKILKVHLYDMHSELRVKNSVAIFKHTVSVKRGFLTTC
jgi:hypothetical protein